MNRQTLSLDQLLVALMTDITIHHINQVMSTSKLMHASKIHIRNRYSLIIFICHYTSRFSLLIKILINAISIQM